jgi:flagellar hook assembly protein FlgD
MQGRARKEVIMSGISAVSDSQMDYMNLLVAQMQNQNPLEPLDNNEMASQLAQFAQLQHLDSMNSSFAEVLATTNRSYANSLLGKTVTFYSENEAVGTLEKMIGTVDSVFNDPDTEESLLGITVGDGAEASEYTLSLDAVLLVEN